MFEPFIQELMLEPMDASNDKVCALADGRTFVLTSLSKLESLCCSTVTCQLSQYNSMPVVFMIGRAST